MDHNSSQYGTHLMHTCIAIYAKGIEMLQQNIVKMKVA